ncbi:MAG TPA: serine hydrolase [Gemmatimonadaceae bacterium]|nr:serine hydrolase [Gemmatimonadaceae bacterium]
MSAWRGLAAVVAVGAMACAVEGNGNGDAGEVEAPVGRAGPRTISAPDSALLRQAALRGDSLPKLRSLIVSWRGGIVTERYYNGARATTPANIKSASKSIVSALVGIAIARGDIAGIDQPISTLLKEETRGLDSAKRAITVEDLLSMRAGLQSTSFENYGAWVSSRNWVRDALRRPVEAPRGDAGPMIYSTGSSHLLSAAIVKAAKTSTHAYADRHLFRPLGIRLRGWTTDPQGIHFGGNEMRLTPREMLAFGELYRNGGTVRIADSTRRIIPKAWIDSSWVRRTSSSWSGNGYGYGWWLTDFRGYATYFAWGYGGQYIFIIPALETTIVITSNPDARSREDGHRRALFEMITDRIIPAVGG